ncbi:hypothetical protein BDY24DRAFT_386753 [Mrakia frigida]|uniref:uncharacterized protein n=1 Tax=Mrakia frigida TaxID=29902 RepID=UPI003FCC1052
MDARMGRAGSRAEAERARRWEQPRQRRGSTSPSSPFRPLLGYPSSGSTFRLARSVAFSHILHRRREHLADLRKPSQQTRPCRPSLGSSSSSPLPPPQPTATTTSTIDTLPSLSISIVEPYPPPRSSPIPIPFASKVDSLELELYSADPLPTRILPPLVKPFKSYLNTTLDSLRQIKHSLGRNSRSRVERSLAKLSESNPSVASSVLEVLARLASGDGSGFVMAYLGWVEVQVVDARDELEVLSKKKIGWDAFTEKYTWSRLNRRIGAADYFAD